MIFSISNFKFQILSIGKTANLICLSAGFLFVASLPAQQLEPVADIHSNQSRIRDEIKSIYKLTKAAKTTTEFEQIVERCEKILVAAVSDKDTKYLNSLIAWSGNRLAEKHVLDASALAEMGLKDQSDEQLQLAGKKFDQLINF